MIRFVFGLFLCCYEFLKIPIKKQKFNCVTQNYFAIYIKTVHCFLRRHFFPSYRMQDAYQVSPLPANEVQKSESIKEWVTRERLHRRVFIKSWFDKAGTAKYRLRFTKLSPYFDLEGSVFDDRFTDRKKVVFKRFQDRQKRILRDRGMCDFGRFVF